MLFEIGLSLRKKLRFPHRAVRITKIQDQGTDLFVSDCDYPRGMRRIHIRVFVQFVAVEGPILFVHRRLAMIVDDVVTLTTGIGRIQARIAA